MSNEEIQKKSHKAYTFAEKCNVDVDNEMLTNNEGVSVRSLEGHRKADVRLRTHFKVLVTLRT